MPEPPPDLPVPLADPPEPVWRGLYYALRTGLAAGIGTALGEILNIDRGWWITLTAIIVVQPDRSATLAKSLTRIIGTLIGAVTATLAATLLPFNAGTAALVVALTVAVGWRFRRLREPLPLALITAVLVFTLDSQSQSLRAGLLRTCLIITGVGIGLGLSLIPLPGERQHH
jgi:uncharacterized membrane protein YccC